jgi:hypothetical protein
MNFSKACFAAELEKLDGIPVFCDLGIHYRAKRAVTVM